MRLVLKVHLLAQLLHYIFTPSLHPVFIFMEHGRTYTLIFFDFSLTVKAAPHECVIRTGQPYTLVKAENEAWFYSKITVGSEQSVLGPHCLSMPLQIF